MEEAEPFPTQPNERRDRERKRVQWISPIGPTVCARACLGIIAHRGDTNGRVVMLAGFYK
jgi:hypothetical protein